MKKIVVLVFAALAFSGLASASLIPSLIGGAPTGPVAGVLTWTYSAALDSAEQLNNGTIGSQKGNTCTSSSGTAPCGNFFTLFDIPNLQTASIAAPSGWQGSFQFTGVINSLTGIPITDSAAVLNVTYTYTGAAVQTGPQVFNGFAFGTTGGDQTGIIAFAFNTGHNPDTGFADQGGGAVAGPVAGVPEPASMLLIGGGLVGLALLRRKVTH